MKITLMIVLFFMSAICQAARQPNCENEALKFAALIGSENGITKGTRAEADFLNFPKSPNQPWETWRVYFLPERGKNYASYSLTLFDLSGHCDLLSFEREDYETFRNATGK